MHCAYVISRPTELSQHDQKQHSSQLNIKTDSLKTDLLIANLRLVGRKNVVAVYGRGGFGGVRRAGVPRIYLTSRSHRALSGTATNYAILSYPRPLG